MDMVRIEQISDGLYKLYIDERLTVSGITIDQVLAYLKRAGIENGKNDMERYSQI